MLNQTLIDTWILIIQNKNQKNIYHSLLHLSGVLTHTVYMYSISTYYGLETAVQLCEVGVTASQRQHSLLCHGTLHIIVLQNDVLLQHLDGKDKVFDVQSGQHHLQVQYRRENSGSVISNHHCFPFYCFHSSSFHHGPSFSLLLFSPCQSCPCPALEGRWSLRCPVEGSAAAEVLCWPSSQKTSSPDFWSFSAKKTRRKNDT